MDAFGVETITTSEGEGEAYKVSSPLGVQETTWEINLPWGSWLFCGSYKLMLADVKKRIEKREKGNQQ